MTLLLPLSYAFAAFYLLAGVAQGARTWRPILFAISLPWSCLSGTTSATELQLIYIVCIIQYAVIGWFIDRWILRCIRRLTAPRPPHAPACAHCGYDLAGNESGRCPECGKPCPGTS